MKHLDLFAGIGGFALAAQSVWEDYESVGMVDFDPYCQQLLKLRFPNALIHGDIKTYKGTQGSADLITGGFPCQPFSVAGKRQGTEDDRHLWPEMLRIIKEVQPTWVIGENVAGLTTWNDGMVFDEVLSDLEAAGYETASVMVPASAVNAPHRRDRIWIVAHHTSKRSGARGTERKGQQRNTTSVGEGSNATDTKNVRNSGRNVFRGGSEYKKPKGKPGGANWDRPWSEVATELCGMDDGIPAKLDGFELSKSRHRVERLKGLGNAIVPQVAAQVMRAIKNHG